MKKSLRVTTFLLLLMSLSSLAKGQPSAITSNQMGSNNSSPIETYGENLDPGNGGNGCSQYNQTVHGSWQDWYENNYRGWAKVTCYAGAAAGVVVIGVGTGSTAAAAEAAAIADAGKIVGCDSISKDTGYDLIRKKVGVKAPLGEIPGICKASCRW